MINFIAILDDLRDQLVRAQANETRCRNLEEECTMQHHELALLRDKNNMLSNELSDCQKVISCLQAENNGLANRIRELEALLDKR